MMTRKTLAIIAATIVVLGASTARAADPEEAVPSTPAEHATAASAYDAEAKQAQEKSASHQLMANRYRNAPVPQKGLNVPMTAMANHCQKLADSYKQAASEATSLAEIHRDAATAAK